MVALDVGVVIGVVVVISLEIYNASILILDFLEKSILSFASFLSLADTTTNSFSFSSDLDLFVFWSSFDFSFFSFFFPSFVFLHVNGWCRGVLGSSVEPMPPGGPVLEETREKKRRIIKENFGKKRKRRGKMWRLQFWLDRSEGVSERQASCWSCQDKMLLLRFALDESSQSYRR